MQMLKKDKQTLVEKCDTIAKPLRFIYGLYFSAYLITNHDLFKQQTIPISKYRTYLSLIYIKQRNNKNPYFSYQSLSLFNYNLKTNEVYN